MAVPSTARTKLQMVRPRLTTLDTRTTRPPPKQADAHYQSSQHQAWSATVIERAGGRCEAALPDGSRCPKARPAHRMFADHIKEVRDGGERFDVDNGQCLCGSHHSLKTALARAARR